ncbi:MAG: hypothetical protein ACPGUV_08240 [Polyangiales bacterium]
MLRCSRGYRQIFCTRPYCTFALLLLGAVVTLCACTAPTAGHTRAKAPRPHGVGIHGLPDEGADRYDAVVDAFDAVLQTETECLQTRASGDWDSFLATEKLPELRRWLQASRATAAPDRLGERPDTPFSALTNEAKLLALFEDGHLRATYRRCTGEDSLAQALVDVICVFVAEVEAAAADDRLVNVTRPQGQALARTLRQRLSLQAFHDPMGTGGYPRGMESEAFRRFSCPPAPPKAHCPP